MDAISKDSLLALLGLLSAAYGLGMAFFTWRRPSGAYYAIFKPRWRYGVNASRQAAFVQVPLYLSASGTLIFGAFHSTLAKAATCVFVFFVFLSVGIFFVDWASADEP